ncbi:MAG TPA: YfiR family protein, partial [Polyangiaceae bacterium]|nr:YfiR family protein [Polyangiaceae bacterium]
VAAVVRRAIAEESPVPVSRQAELLVHVAAYDRNLPARAQGVARVLVVTNPDDADSRAAGAAMQLALRRYDKIAGLPAQVTVVAFPGGPQLAAACRDGHVSIVYVTPGADAVLSELVTALDGVDVLTASAIPRFVAQGIVLGFDLVSGKPTLMINLPQAKRQNVAIDPKVVQLMRLVK